VLLSLVLLWCLRVRCLLLLPPRRCHAGRPWLRQRRQLQAQVLWQRCYHARPVRQQPLQAAHGLLRQQQQERCDANTGGVEAGARSTRCLQQPHALPQQRPAKVVRPTHQPLLWLLLRLRLRLRLLVLVLPLLLVQAPGCTCCWCWS
jgi:hypothetical protein